MTAAEEVVSHLKAVLVELNAHPYPDVACPPNLSKRASVALILRIQPHYAHWPEAVDTAHPAPLVPRQRRPSSQNSTASRQSNFEARLDAFFEQDWVKHGDPEVLFIKRAARTGDKWNGHVALPGGKRDPEDEDDETTAAREALEEVGIDLGHENAIAIGNLPQRIVTTSWGKVPYVVAPHQDPSKGNDSIIQAHGTLPVPIPPHVARLSRSASSANRSSIIALGTRPRASLSRSPHLRIRRRQRTSRQIRTRNQAMVPPSHAIQDDVRCYSPAAHELDALRYHTRLYV